jgi:formate/nitrite transporter FocA (FNT family)
LSFPLSLILTILTGTEFYTGDPMLVPMAAFRSRVSWMKVIRLWFLVYPGNFAGVLFFCRTEGMGTVMIVDSSGTGLITQPGVATVGIAAEKCGYTGLRYYH